jgi:serine/threonine protein kinase
MSLKDYLRMDSLTKNENNSPLNTDEVLILTIMFLFDLLRLHSLNFAHRDIKLDNFIYSIKDKKFKFADLGLSEKYTDSLGFYDTSGTPKYQ